MEILYISNSLPYDKIRHGGGQTFNHYVKKISEKEKVKVIGFCKKEEINLLDYKNYGFDCYPILTRGNFCIDAKRVLFDMYGKIFNKQNGESFYKVYMIKKMVNCLKKQGYVPNIVVLEWTNIVNIIDIIKNIYPEAKYIASEHDVSFLGYYRKYMIANEKEKQKKYKTYVCEKEKELNNLKKCDIIMPHNYKDMNLLIENGIDKNKIFVLTPYYHNMDHINRKEINTDILFWGAMYRKENYEAALWFIENVMPLLKNYNVRFVVAGNRPPKQLKDKENKKVLITGFVEDETPYFEKSLCFVSPLITGAGIKIKILEALSSGIPILTNEIGIEGIPAKDKESYFHCTTAIEYAKIIESLIENFEKFNVGRNGKKVISEYFDLNKGFNEYYEMLKRMND